MGSSRRALRGPANLTAIRARIGDRCYFIFRVFYEDFFSFVVVVVYISEYSHFPFHFADLLDDIQSLPDHGDDGSTGHVVDEAGEERLLLQVLVVHLEVALRGRQLLQGNQLVSALLEAGDDLSDQASENSNF